MVGVSTLSGDGRSVIDGRETSVSLYKPENGFTGMVYAGRHFSDYLSAQASYATNGNDLRLTSVAVSGGVEQTYEQARRARMHTVLGEFMVYFRNRRNRLRPYLSAGPGISRTSTRAGAVLTLRGNPSLPAARVSDTALAFRVAVGMDVRLGDRFSFRYSFAETIQRNPVSPLLTPAGKRNLANFQNLFGIHGRF